MNSESATFMGIYVAPDANSLDVIKDVRKIWDAQILPQLPEGIAGSIPYDGTEYIQDSIDEVITTIIEAGDHRDRGDLPVPRLAAQR